MTNDKINWPTEAEVRAAFPAPPDFGATIHMMPVADHEAEIARLTAERDAVLAGAVKVKPLVWEQLGDRAWRAPSPFFGSFRVECYGDGPWQALWSVPVFCGTFVDGDFAGPDDAKRAIDARIRAALQPDPEGRQTGTAQCCMCGKIGLSTAEDGGPECELHDGRWVCGRDCYDRVIEDIDRQVDLAKLWMMATAAIAERAKSELSAAWAADLIVQWAQSLTPPADLAAKIEGE